LHHLGPKPLDALDNRLAMTDSGDAAALAARVLVRDPRPVETQMQTLNLNSPIPIGRACSTESGRYYMSSVRIRRIDRVNGASVQYADATNGHMLVRTVVSTDMPLDIGGALIGRKAIGSGSKAGKPQMLVKCGDVYNVPGSDVEGGGSFPPVSDVGPISGNVEALAGSVVDVKVSALRQLLESIEDRSEGKRSSDSQVVRIHVPADERKPLRFMSETVGGAPILAMMMPMAIGNKTKSSNRFPEYVDAWNRAWNKGESR
jgi:hypothetical protein